MDNPVKYKYNLLPPVII